MNVYTEIATMRPELSGLASESPLAFVPTMGALHEGHRACINVARSVPGAHVVVSIYVNPTQFVAGEDLDRYPRPVEADLNRCAEWGVDAVFLPSNEEMYPQPQSVWVDVDGLSDPLCGRSRPGHFRGVATVVAKLFNAVGPDVAVFGQKDAQQALVLRAMVNQLGLPIEVRLARTAREPDGLAISSRNAYLDEQSRQIAPGIHGSFTAARAEIEAGERNPAAVGAAVRSRLAAAGIADVEYVEVLAANDLSPWAEIDGKGILAVAAHIGGARLIDNVVFDVDGDVVTWDTALF